MIYFVSKQQSLFGIEGITNISLRQSLDMAASWDMLQIDSETTGRDPHLCDLLCFQIGDIKGDNQIVIDTTTIDIREYKDLLQERYVIGHNLKFDLQFLFNYGIIPRKVYDTMIVEQLLYLGYPNSVIKYSLKEVAWRRLDKDIDKTVRGEIIWRGLDRATIMYAAGDVTYLGDIMKSQIEDCKKKECLIGAKIECDAVPAIAYMEWCGIHLDTTKWQAKMADDKVRLQKSKKALDDFLVANKDTVPEFKKYVYVDTQGDLFLGYNLEPKCLINWSSSRQVVEIAKILGFDTKVKDKKTGEDKESVLEKHLKMQKGINDEFLKLYFDYQGDFKVVSSFGQGHLDCINPITDRIHTSYRQLGASSGRMSCGSQQSNSDLERCKKLPKGSCTFPNMQQVPSDAITRGCFTAPKGYMWCSCDFSALESRLGADIYNEKSMLKEFLEGSGDMHSLCAYMVYKEIPRDTSIKDIKKLYPHLRKAVKGIEFRKKNHKNNDKII